MATNGKDGYTGVCHHGVRPLSVAFACRIYVVCHMCRVLYSDSVNTHAHTFVLGKTRTRPIDTQDGTGSAQVGNSDVGGNSLATPELFVHKRP